MCLVHFLDKLTKIAIEVEVSSNAGHKNRLTDTGLSKSWVSEATSQQWLMATWTGIYTVTVIRLYLPGMIGKCFNYIFTCNFDVIIFY